ncbi:hypothetical protein L1887_36671 [Cichorium endivia]|nr:hypothetical protein L1887_36671 [Cichorium endivia]
MIGLRILMEYERMWNIILTSSTGSTGYPVLLFSSAPVPKRSGGERRLVFGSVGRLQASKDLDSSDGRSSCVRDERNGIQAEIDWKDDRLERIRELEGSGIAGFQRS